MYIQLHCIYLYLHISDGRVESRAGGWTTERAVNRVSFAFSAPLELFWFTSYSVSSRKSLMTSGDLTFDLTLKMTEVILSLILDELSDTCDISQRSSGAKLEGGVQAPPPAGRGILGPPAGRGLTQVDRPKKAALVHS